MIDTGIRLPAEMITTPRAARSLGCAVIIQAVRDLRDNDIVIALDAALFLSGPDVPIWFDALNIGFADGIAFLLSGRAGRPIWRTRNDR